MIALYYYARVARVMVFEEAPDGDTSPIRVPVSLMAAISLSLAAVVVFGIVPGVVTHFTDFGSMLAAGG